MFSYRKLVIKSDASELWHSFFGNFKMKLTTFLVSATLVHFTNAVNGLFGTGFYKIKGFEIDAGSFTEKSSNLRFVETKWITQRLNNFNPQDNRTWEMRYMENNHYLQDGGPIFIYVGGEWTISSMWLRTGHMHDMARDLNGTMLNTEHRYYGESRPTPDLTTENLVFLTDDQALADLAHFIVEIKNTIPEVRNSGVILVGASYSATMATWFLQKYPHLANGAWSSSAPLNAKLDFKEYMETVSESIEQVGGKSCARRIQEAFKSLEQMIASKNVSRIEKLFLFCKPFNLTAELDVWSFFSTVSGIISGVVQYHKRAHQNIQKMCSQLVDINIVNDVDALANWFRKQNDGSCIDYRYESSLEISKVEWGANYEYMRQWYYQTCAEFGWFQSSGANNSMFGSSFPVNLYVQQCKDAFGEK